MNLSIKEFSNCDNPKFARASFLIENVLEDISEDWGYMISVFPGPANITKAWLEIIFIYHSKIYSFIVFENGEVSRIKSRKNVKTGDLIYNDDIQILEEIKVIYELCPKNIDKIVNLENAVFKDDLENISVQLLNIITDIIDS